MHIGNFWTDTDELWFGNHNIDAILNLYFLNSHKHCHVYERLQTRFWIIVFTDHLQEVTTNNYYTVDDFHTLQINTAHAKSFRASIVFTGHFLTTASNNNYYSVSVLSPL
jgi:hypothetical protein